MHPHASTQTGVIASPDLHVTRTDKSSFAFVEYESRRDADDAYYEMHNFPFGRHEILKVEVGQATDSLLPQC